MPQLDSDTFTYSNGGLGTVSGGKWTDCSIGAAIPVVSNQLVGPSSEHAAVITTWAGSTTLQYSECVWQSGDFGGPTIFSDTANNFYMMDIRGSTFIHLYRVVAGVFIDLTGASAVVAVAGHVYRLYMSVAGTLVGADNGVDILSVGPAEIALTTGKPGLRVWGVTLDDWAGGDFSSATGQPIVKRAGGVPHVGRGGLKNNFGGGPWGRSRQGVRIPHWLADQEREAA